MSNLLDKFAWIYDSPETKRDDKVYKKKQDVEIHDGTEHIKGHEFTDPS